MKFEYDQLIIIINQVLSLVLNSADGLDMSPSPVSLRFQGQSAVGFDFELWLSVIINKVVKPKLVLNSVKIAFKQCSQHGHVPMPCLTMLSRSKCGRL